jgi:hypothetical protein
MAARISFTQGPSTADGFPKLHSWKSPVPQKQPMFPSQPVLRTQSSTALQSGAWSPYVEHAGGSPHLLCSQAVHAGLLEISLGAVIQPLLPNTPLVVTPASTVQLPVVPVPFVPPLVELSGEQ